MENLFILYVGLSSYAVRVENRDNLSPFYSMYLDSPALGVFEYILSKS